MLGLDQNQVACLLIFGPLAVACTVAALIGALRQIQSA